MRELLMIGGTHGGLTITVDDKCQDVQLPVRRVGFQRSIGEAIQLEEYVRGELVDASGSKHEVLICRGEDPVLVLMKHYQNV